MQLIEYKKFEEYINHIKETFHWCDQVKKLFGDAPEVFLVDDLVELLTAITRDEDRWIESWIYDLNFGAYYEPGSVVVDGENVPLFSVWNLYEVVAKNFKAQETDSHDKG